MNAQPQSPSFSPLATADQPIVPNGRLYGRCGSVGAFASCFGAPFSLGALWGPIPSFSRMSAIRRFTEAA
jgi:hypothetical protein